MSELSTNKRKKVISRKGSNSLLIKPVLNPSAQSATLCEPGTPESIQVKMIYDLLMFNKSISDVDKAIIELQLLSGCRIGSALQIGRNDITSIGQVRVPAEKGGLSVIVMPQLFRDFWLDMRVSGIVISQFRNRFYMYRLYRKYGIYSVLAGNVNRSVTHLLRHLVIGSTENLDITKRERANYAGQKSTVSQEHYLPSERSRRKR